MAEKILDRDRIFHIVDAAVYPGKDFCDMVFYYPPSENMKKRIWMLTYAKNPLVKIDDYEFKAVNVIKKGSSRWIDYGTTDADLRGSKEGFCQLRISGINLQQLQSSYLIVTAQTEQELSGSIGDAEEQLFGIKRADAGNVCISPSSVTAGSPTEFNLIYQGSKKPLPPGSYIKFSVPNSFALPQCTDKNTDGWIEITASDTDRIELVSIKPSDESLGYNDIIYSLPEGLKAEGKINLKYATAFTFVFESTYKETERRYWYSKLPPLATSVAVDERKNFVSPVPENSFNVRFSAGDPEKLHLFLPGRRKEGEPVYLTGIATDRYRNITDKNWKMDIILKIEGSREEIKDISGFFTHKYRFLMPLDNLQQGVYRARAVDRKTGKIMAVSNPLEITGRDSCKQNIYWGEIHGHSEMSDGIGSFEDMLQKAEEVGLDFAAGADHACYFTDNQWEWMQDVVNCFDRPGIFCSLIGYEWAGKQGHRNIYTSESRLKLFRGMYGPESNLDVVYGTFKGNPEIVAGPHTKHAGINPKSTQKFWMYRDPEVERFFEIYSVWGNYEEYANMALNEGAEIGFTGGGDYHSGRCFFSTEVKGGQGKVPHSYSKASLYKCGVTGCFADSLDRASIIKALRERKTYATTGAKILIDYNISGISMGQKDKTKNPLIEAEIHGCGTVSKIEVVRNGEVIHSENCGFLDGSFQFEDKEPCSKNWYYMKVYQEDGEMAWTSPIWIEP